MLMVVHTGSLERAFTGEALDDGQNYVPADGMVMIIVRPGYEQTARDSLRRRGIGAWWPNYPKEESAKDGATGKRYVRLVRAGVMPGIILSPSRLNSHFWACIDLAPGAVNVVRKLNGDALVLEDIDIVLMHKIEAMLNLPVPEKVVHSFKKGDKVRFVDEVLRRVPAFILGKALKDGQFMAEVNLLGQLTPMKVHPSKIEIAQDT